ncbi:MAG: Phosphoenolpyruvate synthase [Candidatus Peregrinibacteria bacterium GW2011_GWA2_33_10]|nr:MAG: Phosphoenolpyruvate synthase [Candidatus Peregrinibacteria bacterium GW2011_GWA2_33_10]KKP40099.1 MAG: phosphoenolpyruvate synthase [Candidatus Peregrinibacteria bacterium GW2011_GWC2_33_13]OGJ48285.1 MAG: hypothetical protein A2229_04070 [Candidatus Peregrinibacteria bacterium RIFOXYA2_FULL_33_7]
MSISSVPNYTIFNKHLPDVYKIEAITKKGKPLIKFIQEVCQKEPLAEKNLKRLLDEIRWKFYSTGILEVDELEEQGEEYKNYYLELEKANGNTEKLSPLQAREQLKNWKTIVALSKLSELSRSAIDTVLGHAYAKTIDYSEFPPDPKEFFEGENAEGKIIKAPHQKTPTHTLLKILALEETNNNPNYNKLKHGALEHLIRRFISEDPYRIAIAKKALKYADFQTIIKNTKGALSEGLIGGKAAGYFLSQALMRLKDKNYDRSFAKEIYAEDPRIKSADPRKKEELAYEIFKEEYQGIDEIFEETESYCIGSKVFEDFTTKNPEINDLIVEKYRYENGSTPDSKNEDEQLAEVRNRFRSVDLPDYIKRRLFEMWVEFFKSETISLKIRSSSHLEDGKASFAGIHDSIDFLMPQNLKIGQAYNENELEDIYENMSQKNPNVLNKDFIEFIKAYLPPEIKNINSAIESLLSFFESIKNVWSCVYSKKAYNYRREHGLISYDEEMSVLIQKTNGDLYGDYFCPLFGGVAESFAAESFGPPQEDGGTTLVMGDLKRAVEVGGYPCVLSKPTDCPDDKNTKHQSKITAMNIKNGKLEEVALDDFINKMNPQQQTTAAIQLLKCTQPGWEGRFNVLRVEEKYLKCAKIDFKHILKEKLANYLKYILKKLKYYYGMDVDIEYTCRFDERGKLKIRIIQCRPQIEPEGAGACVVPENIPEKHYLFQTRNCLSSRPQKNIRYLFFIDPIIYQKTDFRILDKLHLYLEKFDKQMQKGDYFIANPRRFGVNDVETNSGSHTEKGMNIKNGDFTNAAGFVEMMDGNKEPSQGLHFFRIIRERKQSCFGVQIPQLSDNFKIQDNRISDNEGFNGKLIANAANCSEQFNLDIPEELKPFIKIIDFEEEGKKHGIENCRLHLAQNNRGARFGQIKESERNDEDKKVRLSTLYMAEKDKHTAQMLKPYIEEITAQAA